MAISDELSFGGAIATELLIGRHDEQQQIRRAIGPAAARDFRCVMIEAEGGLGKTRLLREISTLLGTLPPPQPAPAPRRRMWRYANVVALPLIDVADPYLHTVVPFLRTVRDGLGQVPRLRAGQIFAAFDAAVDAYEQARDGEKSFGEVAELRDQVTAAFEAAYHTLTRKKRVVWLIDTFEQLFRSREEIESLFTEGEVIERPLEQLTFSWLRRFIGQLPEQTTLILAGRPRPHLWTLEIAALVGTALMARADARPAQGDAAPADGAAPVSAMLTTLALVNFSVAQIREYLAALYEQLEGQEAYATLAAYLHDNLLADPEQPEIIHLLTDGNPIRLAIYIDLLLNSDTHVAAFRQNLAALKAMSPAQREQLRLEVDHALLSYLTDNLSSPEHQVIELLALMRRGLDLDRLRAIWRDDEAAAAETIRNLLRLSFVKYRWKSPSHVSNVADPDPAEIRVFLHDEFYAIYQHSFLSEDPERLALRRAEQQDLFRKLMAFCDTRFAWVRDSIPGKLAELNQLTPLIHDRTATPAQRQAYLALKDELRRLRHERRQLRTESLHYELYDDAEVAFYRRFFRRSEQAFSANAVEHDAQLQSEIDLFFFGNTAEENSRQVGLAGPRWDELRFAVVLQQVSGWIKRLTTYNRYGAAARLAAKASRTFVGTAEQWYQGWLPAVRATPAGQQLELLYKLEWEANGLFAAILAGRRITETIASLRRVTDALELALRTYSPGADRPRLPGLEGAVPLTMIQSERFRNVVAQCLLMIGYAYASLSQFGTARRYYRAGIAEVERTGFQSLRAELKNDLSRVLGELGDLNQAQLFCQEGFVIRRARGFDFLTALSYNTMALIYSRNWLPLKARIWAETALSLFRQLDQPRGIGLALLQAAEARRRSVSLVLAEAQLVQANHAARLVLSPTLIGRARSDLERAAEHLAEAEAVFSERVPELVRQIEVYTERAALFREWSSLHGEDAGGPLVQQAHADLDRVIALTSGPIAGDDYAKFRLSALINKAGLYQRARQTPLVRQALEEADALIEPGYRLHEGGPLALNPDEVKEVFFRELARMETIRAAVELDEPGDEAEIRHYVLAITYYQLYSPYETPGLGLARRRLATLLNRLREARSGDDRELREIVAQVMDDYHLYALKDYFEERERSFDIGPRTDLAAQQIF